ncbi:MAG: hypothetical protein GDYSWBUE_002015 [Candidatus Fervidibacterota bacterium]
MGIAFASGHAMAAQGKQNEGQVEEQNEGSNPLVCISGVIPQLTPKAEHKPRSESGIGALMPWANRLWFITYVSHKRGTGAGTGLFFIDDTLKLHKHPESAVGTYANRLIHPPTDTCVIGPHLIDTDGNVVTIKAIIEHRLTATMPHHEDPQNKLLFLTMEGLLIEVDLRTLQAKTLFDLTKELHLPSGTAHFKGGWTAHGRIIVANNTYTEQDFLGKQSFGRLAEWDGKRWQIVEAKPFVEVTGRQSLSDAIYALGWDKASALLKVFVNGEWHTYRLPKATHAFDHTWLTEWWRIREVETERWLVDCHGIFYEMPSTLYGGKFLVLRPVCTHLRVIPDFCSWNGLLVLAGNQVSPVGNMWNVGQPQSGLWFGKTDDLWHFGKPKGFGGVWWETPVKAGQPSEPFLMTGFERKCLHLYHDSDTVVWFTVEVDFLGDGTWKVYDVISVPPGKYVHHEFPDGFSAHWVRLTASRSCIATAYFHYL